jgi:hypothetical protein
MAEKHLKKYKENNGKISRRGGGIRKGERGRGLLLLEWFYGGSHRVILNGM